jgi:ribulose-5-phosphate 4-epimerase/fuculose-1-phosphate aldolase
MIKDELRDEAVRLAKERYGDNWLAGLWGSASVLLSEKELKIIINVMEK